MDNEKKLNGSDSNERNLSTLISGGEEAFKDGAIEDAKEFFKRAVTIDPENSRAHNNLGVVYHHMNRLEKSLHHYRVATQLTPLNITYKKNLADFLFVIKDQPQEAMRIYNSVLELEPHDLETLIAVGIICQSLNRDEDARFFLEKARRLDPGNPVVRDRLKRLKE